MAEPEAASRIRGLRLHAAVCMSTPESASIDGELLHLGPGMRINMCHDGGEDHVIGTFEELSAQGMPWPCRINVGHLTIRVRAGISVFAKYVAGRNP